MDGDIHLSAIAETGRQQVRGRRACQGELCFEWVSREIPMAALRRGFRSLVTQQTEKVGRERVEAARKWKSSHKLWHLMIKESKEMQQVLKGRMCIHLVYFLFYDALTSGTWRESSRHSK